MSEEQKNFSEEEMNKVKEFQQKYFEIQSTFGQFTLARIKLEQQLADISKNAEKLREDFITTQTEEAKFIDEMTKKYGEGTLDPQTGAFVPNTEEKKSDIKE